ncbi:bromo and FHA domain-containing protein DDB_G0267958 isoform X2 [Scophthalmus maximus]|uniref:bromo and FHA domain-containing protein DDB_G0267958 isoform X2 n=1 Tax=Scophthalmus maximus TaxID=52904 RepID=UPI0015E07267|nr:bromo and FHA domain-containing protein DDB_G0267958 isoform X2 [Scophthalmus maximus]
MASDNTDGGAVEIEENGATASEANEHDYAHAVDGTANPAEAPSSLAAAPADDGGVAAAAAAQDNCTTPPVQAAAPLPVELPEPAVGAEVDCPGGNYVDAPPLPAQTGEAPPKTVAPVPGQRGGRRRSSRPEDRSCSSCKAEFERQGRSFNRRAVYTFTTPDTVHWAFPGSAVHDKSFLCETCAQLIRSKCKRKQTGKRSLWLKPPATKRSDARDKKKKGSRMGKKSKAAQLVSKSCYKAAFKMLWSAKGARKPMMEFWCKQLKEEMKVLSRQAGSPFHQKVTSRKPLSSFPWRRCLNWAQDKAPLVTSCLRALFPDINALSKSSHQMSEEQAQTLLERRTVAALSIPLFTRNIWKNNFLQAALGAELRLQGCSGSALDALNTMGLCQNKDTVRLLLHRLRNGKKNSTQNGRQRLRLKQDQMKGEQMSDVEEEDIEEEEEEEEEEEVVEEDDDEEEEEEEEEEIQLAVEEEVEQEEVQDEVPEEEEEEEEEQAPEAQEEKKRRRKKAKKQRKEEKRKERGKRKAKEREEEEEDEDDDDDEGSEQKKRRVVVVRLGLLKGHSEVGRSDLSAP